jgi:ferrous iron transport protein B
MGATASVATIMGLVAKEEVVAVFGVLEFMGMSKLVAYSFLIFNLLCAPCFAAMGAIKREMNSVKWTLFAIGYQTVFAYAVSFIVYQVGSFFGSSFGVLDIIGFVLALVVFAFLCYLLFRPANKSVKNVKTVKA